MPDSHAIRTTASQFVEALFADQPRRPDDFVTPGFVWQGPSLLGNHGGGIGELLSFAETLRSAFPGLTLAPETPIVEGNSAAVRWTIRGCHNGSTLGAPTRRLVLFTGIHFLHFEPTANGGARISALWQQWGQMGLLQNLGIIPFIGGPGTELPGPTIECEPAPQAVTARNDSNQPAANKEMIQRLFNDVINNNDLRLIDQWVAPNISDHNPGPSDLPGRDGVKQVCNLLRKAFPDFNGSIDEIISEGDRVAVRWTVHGTNSCNCAGIDATERKMTGTGIDIVRIAAAEDGRSQVTDRWGNSDDTGILLQLDIISRETMSI